MEETNQSANIPDDIIRQHIIDKLTKDPGIDTSKIHIEVENAKVILKGKADTEDEKHLAVKLARAVEGVREVENHLQVELGIIHALTSLAAHIQGDIIRNDDKKND
jgi:osmotically-inducible protein OsmY